MRGWDACSKEADRRTPRRARSSTTKGVGARGGQDAIEKSFEQKAEIIATKPVESRDGGAQAGDRDPASASPRRWSRRTGSVGPARLRAGTVLEIDGLGERFSGRYFVDVDHPHHRRQRLHHPVRVPPRRGLSHAARERHRHRHRRRPRRPGAARPGAGEAPAPERRAERLGRLATPMGGKDRGLFFRPEVDDEVLVAFEHGDPRRPYVLGALWSKVDPPPADDGKRRRQQLAVLPIAQRPRAEVRRHRAAPSGSRSSARAATTSSSIDVRAARSRSPAERRRRDLGARGQGDDRRQRRSRSRPATSLTLEAERRHDDQGPTVDIN